MLTLRQQFDSWHKSLPSLFLDGIFLILTIYALRYLFLGMRLRYAVPLFGFLLFFVVLFYFSERSAVYLYFLLLPLAGLPSRLIGLSLVTPLVLFLSLTFVVALLMKRILTALFPAEESNGPDQIGWLAGPTRNGVYLWALFLVLSFTFLVLRIYNLYPLSGDPFHNYIINRSDHTANHVFLHSLVITSSVVAGLFLFLYFSRKIDLVWLKNIFSTLFLSFVAVSLIAFLQTQGALSFLKAEGIWSRLDRFNATFSDPNALGTSLIFLFPVAVAAALYRKGWMRLIPLLAMIASFYLLFLTASKTAFFSICLEIVLLGILFSARGVLQGYVRRVLTWLGIGIAALAITAPVGLTYSRDTELYTRVSRWTDFAVENLQEGTFLENLDKIARRRAEWWPSAIRMFEEHPLTGVGIGAFPFETMNHGSQHFDSAGNFYLQTVAELGLWGVLFVMAASLLAGYLSLRLLSCSRKLLLQDEGLLILSLLISLFVFMIMLFVGSHTLHHEVNVLFMLFLAALVASYREVLPEEAAQSSRLNRAPGWLQLGIPVLALGIFTTQSIASLSHEDPKTFRAKIIQRKQDFFGYGMEDWGGYTARWTAPRSSTELLVKKIPIEFEIYSPYPRIAKEPVTVRFFVNGEERKEVIVDKTEWTPVKIDIPESLSGKEINFEVVTKPAWRPRDHGISDDRQLGVAIRGLELY